MYKKRADKTKDKHERAQNMPVFDIKEQVDSKTFSIDPERVNFDLTAFLVNFKEVLIKDEHNTL